MCFVRVNLSRTIVVRVYNVFNASCPIFHLLYQQNNRGRHRAFPWEYNVIAKTCTFTNICSWSLRRKKSLSPTDTSVNWSNVCQSSKAWSKILGKEHNSPIDVFGGFYENILGYEWNVVGILKQSLFNSHDSSEI